MARRIIFLLWLLAVSAPASAQQVPPVAPLPPAEDSRATFRSSVDLVTLNVTVTDGKDRHLPGLGQQDFQVLEDGVPQDLSYFAANELPLDIALLIDASSSMVGKLDLVHQAADRFVATLRPGDRGQVTAFSSQTRVLQPFTEDVAALRSAIRLTGARGATSLYTALYVALDQFQRLVAKSPDVRRPAIVVLTDGQDTASLIEFDDVLERARRAGVAIYAISVISAYEGRAAMEDGRRRHVTEADHALRTLARETGGRAYFPLALSELDGVYQGVASELSTQYALGYAPRGPRDDGAFHRIAVRVVSRPDARPRTRTGYYAPRAAASLSRPQPHGR